MSDPGNDSTTLRGRGLELREAQLYAEAEALFARAAVHFPNDPALAFGHAQTRYELGYPAAALFARAQLQAPGNLEITRNHALALISEGQRDQARALLEAELARRPE